MCEVVTEDEYYETSSMESNRQEDIRWDQEDYVVKDLISMILQFMEASGLEESFNSLWHECGKFGIPLPAENSKKSPFKEHSFQPRDAYLLFKYFDVEEKDNLLSQWSKFISAIDQEYQEDFKKITFFVRIFVAIIPFRNKLAETESKEQSMKELREFFQAKSDEFSADEKMLSLFALPFVAEPAAHPVFSEIFQDAWKYKLRSQISISVKRYYEINNLPMIGSTDLVQLYLSTVRDEEEDTQQREERFRHNSKPKDDETASTSSKLETALSNNEKQYESLETPLLDIELRYHKLLKVTAELVAALEATVQGEAQDMFALRNRTVTHFPELFSTGEPRGQMDTAVSIKPRPQQIQNQPSRITSKTHETSFGVNINDEPEELRCNSLQVSDDAINDVKTLSQYIPPTHQKLLEPRAREETSNNTFDSKILQTTAHHDFKPHTNDQIQEGSKTQVCCKKQTIEDRDNIFGTAQSKNNSMFTEPVEKLINSAQSGIHKSTKGGESFTVLNDDSNTNIKSTPSKKHHSHKHSASRQKTKTNNEPQNDCSAAAYIESNSVQESPSLAATFSVTSRSGSANNNNGDNKLPRKQFLVRQS